MVRDLLSRAVGGRSGRAARRGRMFSRHHPRVLMAVKTACAAALAWLVVQPVGGFVHQYPYYAPLGAAVAMATTVADSVRFTVQSVVAILTGAVLALLTQELHVGELGGVAIVTGVGTLLAGWPMLGALGSWVPVAGLFVLIVGGDAPQHYVISYGGLTAVGAVIGVAVNAAVPQLPLAPATRAQATLRAALARELTNLADALIAEDQLSSGAWEAVTVSLDPHTRHVDELLRIGLDARRANWRASRWAEIADHRHRQGRSLRRLAGCVEQVVALVSVGDAPWHDRDERGRALRTAIAKALKRTATMIRHLDEEDPEAGRREWRQAADAVRGLREKVTQLPQDTGGRGIEAAAIVVSLERAVSLWE